MNKIFRRKINKNKKTLSVILIWTLILAGLFIIDLYMIEKSMQNLAIKEARANFQKDEAFRFWSATHGGFYVPVSKRTPPNPNLKHIFERDIETPSGIKLTLMNPAYALRHMNEDFAENYGTVGHITSLKLLRPENAPDDWEHSALNLFEKGEQEIIDFSEIKKKPFLRLMKPLLIQKGCLKCHAHQDYKIGDVRGGVSVSVPLTDYFLEKQQAVTTHMLSFIFIWIIGLLIIVRAAYIINKSNFEKRKAQRRLQESHNELENRVLQKTDELNKTNIKLKDEIINHLATGEKIRESEEKYKALYENAPLSYQSLDIDGNFLDVNPTWLNTLGYKKEEVIGKWFGDFLRQDFVEHFKKNFPEFKKQGNISDVQFYMKKKNGKYLFISFEGCIGYTPDGNFKQTYCTFKDITEQKEAEELSIENEELFRKIYQSNVIGVAFSDENNNLTGVNSMFCNMLGYTEKELLIKNVLDITYPEDIKQSKIIINQTRDKNNSVKKVEKRYIRKDGNIILCQTTVSKIEIISKAKYYNVAIIEDITERKKNEYELTKYQTKLEELVKERTAELEEKNKSLEEYNNLFVGREFRIKELRDKVKELEGKK